VARPPGAAVGMTMRAQMAQPAPAALGTLGVGPQVPRGVHGLGPSVREGHGSGRHRRRGVGMHGLSLAQGTRGLCRQALKRFGRLGAVARGLRRHGWRRQTWRGPRDGQHDAEPHENA